MLHPNPNSAETQEISEDVEGPVACNRLGHFIQSKEKLLHVSPPLRGSTTSRRPLWELEVAHSILRNTAPTSIPDDMKDCYLSVRLRARKGSVACLGCNAWVM